MTPFELALRIAGVALLATLAAVLWRARRRDHVARIGAALCASVAAFMVTSMPGASAFFGALIYPLAALCSTHPVWFWLFCTALFADGFRLERRHVVALVAMAVAGVTYQSLWEPGGTSAFVGSLGAAFGAASLAFAALAPVAVHAGAAGDLDPRRSRLRRIFVPAAALYLALLVATQLVALWRGERTPRPLVVLNIALLDAAAVLALLSFVRLRVVNWLDVTEPAGTSADLSPAERVALERVRRRVDAERLYAREGLTIAGLAVLLDTQEHVLRRAINVGLGFRNFNDFLHAHRLREAATRLRDPAGRRVPVLTIALDVGYGSIGPFNRAFRARFGMTPTEFRRQPEQPAEPACATRDTLPGTPSV